MIKSELFEKYSIDDSHSKWEDHIDNWYSVEIYRVMHNGKLPLKNDLSLKYITDFLDGIKSHKLTGELIKRRDFGSLFLTAKRLVYTLSDEILKEL